MDQDGFARPRTTEALARGAFRRGNGNAVEETNGKVPGRDRLRAVPRDVRKNHFVRILPKEAAADHGRNKSRLIRFFIGYFPHFLGDTPRTHHPSREVMHVEARRVSYDVRSGTHPRGVQCSPSTACRWRTLTFCSN